MKITLPQITQGPWALLPSGGAIGAAHNPLNNQIAWTHDTPIPQDERAANAQAIAQVPALLSTLAALLPLIRPIHAPRMSDEQHARHGEMPAEWQAGMDALKAAGASIA